jgi:formylmethanofuran dehydrogenase subunit E
MRTTKNYRPRHTLQKKDCERCGFTYLKNELIRQRGISVCKDCYDEKDRGEK